MRRPRCDLAPDDARTPDDGDPPRGQLALRRLKQDYLRWTGSALLSTRPVSPWHTDHAWDAVRLAKEARTPVTQVKRMIWAAHLEFIDQRLDGDVGTERTMPFESADIDRHSAATRFYLAEVSRIYDDAGDPSVSGRHAPPDRTQALRSIIAGGEFDESVATEQLGVNFADHHVAGILSCPPGGGVASINLVRVALAFSRAVGGQQPLVALNGASEVWMWTRWTEQPTLGPLTYLSASLAVPAGLRMILGPIAPGLRGFRRSMLGAQAAQRALGSAPTRHWLNRYEDVPAVHLLAGEQDQARWWAEEVLGGLAGDDNYHRELRETLRLYLAMGRSRAKVATELHVHRNTIAYRVNKALHLLGREVAADDFDVRLALEIARR